jgi:ubiquinol-cytochrome c reductase iron-sulfur subunit
LGQWQRGAAQDMSNSPPPTGADDRVPPTAATAPSRAHEIERQQEILDTRFMADIGPAREGWGRREFLNITTILTAFAGINFFIWPFVHSMNPAADVEALASTEVDLSAIESGQSVTVVWRGKPIFIRRRTQEEIDAARSVSLSDLPDPVADEDRVHNPEWLVIVGICNHLGCVPRGQRTTDPHGDYGGWFCPCHGSHFDTSGRIRKGPAPNNMEVPPYTFVNDTSIRIG